MHTKLKNLWTTVKFFEHEIIFEAPLYRKYFTLIFVVFFISFFNIPITVEQSSSSFFKVILIICVSFFLYKQINDDSLNCKFILKFEKKTIHVCNGVNAGEYIVSKFLCVEYKGQYIDDPDLCQLYAQTTDGQVILLHQTFWSNRVKVFEVATRLSELMKVPVDFKIT